MKQLNQEERSLREEIIARGMATAEQLDAEELSVEFMNACHSKVNRYLSLARPQDVDAAYGKVLRARNGHIENENRKASAFWTGLQNNSSEAIQEGNRYAEIGDRWADEHPQYISVPENMKLVGQELYKRNWLPTYEHLSEVFMDLVRAGQLIIAVENIPNAPSDAPAEASGRLLQMWIEKMPELLEPVVPLSDEEKERRRIASLSSDEYQKEFLPDDSTPALILKRIEREVADFCKRHPEYDPLPEGKEILLSWIRQQGMPIGYDSLEASFKANKEKLQEANCIFDVAPGSPVKYGASTLKDNRRPHIPNAERAVEIREPDTAKRFSLNEILSWDSATMLKMMNLYPDLKNQIDNM